MTDLATLFLAGLTAAIGPCLLFCSPVLVPFVAGTKTNLRQSLVDAIAFSGARLGAFVLLGILVTQLGESAVRMIGRHQHLAVLVTGAAIAGIGLLVLFGLDLESKLCHRLHDAVTQGTEGSVLLGLLMGLFPCAPKIAVLAYIAVQAHTVWRGTTMALAFGLGEVWSPVVILAGLAGLLPKSLSSPGARTTLRRVSGFFVLIIGLRLILLYL